MKLRHFLSLADLTPAELEAILHRAAQLKSDLRKGRRQQPLIGKTLGLFFSKSSTRTRVSFEVAMAQLGGTSLLLPEAELQMVRGEGIADTARVLSRYLNALVIRTLAHKDLEAWASSTSIPIINGLTDLHHPCQALGDLLTIKEQTGSLKGVALAYIGDGNNVAHSLIEGAAHTGMSIRLACPKGYGPKNSIIQTARRVASTTGAEISVFKEARTAARNADILYTDVWVSMGQERESKIRKKAFKPYQINKSLLQIAKPTARVMHCLPANRGNEITGDILDGPQSLVWEQAENRLHAQKALIEWILQ